MSASAAGCACCLGLLCEATNDASPKGTVVRCLLSDCSGCWVLREYTHKNGLYGALWEDDAAKLRAMVYSGTKSWLHGATLAYNLSIARGETDALYTACQLLFDVLQAQSNASYQWLVAGHSLGGVAAMMIAGQHGLNGMAFNTFAVSYRHRFRCDAAQLEFIVHNTQFAGQQKGSGQYFFGRLVTHHDLNPMDLECFGTHGIKHMVQEHLQHGCGSHSVRHSCRHRALISPVIAPALGAVVREAAGGLSQMVQGAFHSRDVVDGAADIVVGATRVLIAAPLDGLSTLVGL